VELLDFYRAYLWTIYTKDCSHSLALFSLLPVRGNERAERVVSHPDNSHHVSTLSDGALALDVGFRIRGKSSKTLATLERGVEADIYVEGFSIAKGPMLFRNRFRYRRYYAL